MDSVPEWSPVMPQAIADPEELKRFALLLKKFNTDLVDQTSALAGQLE